MTEYDKERLSQLSQQGYQLLREYMTPEARAKFEEILAEDPENNYALVGLGDLERKERHFESAVDYYQRCLQSHPENNYALFGLAESLRALKRFNRAVEVWERYLQYDSDNITVLTRVGDVYRKTRNFHRSRELYLRVLDLDPDNPYALIGLGHLHYDFKEFDSARHYWERMYELRGQGVDIRVLTSLGNCHRKLKTYDQGIPFFKNALEREPANFYALYGLADCYRGLQRPEESLIYWHRILQIDPNNKVILTRAGDAYRTMEDLEQAESYYRRALNVQFDLYAILGLAIIHRLQGRTDDAITALEDLAKNSPRNGRVFLELSGCYQKQGRIIEALAVLARHVEATKSPARSVQRKINELKSQL